MLVFPSRRTPAYQHTSAHRWSSPRSQQLVPPPLHLLSEKAKRIGHSSYRRSTDRKKGTEKTKQKWLTSTATFKPCERTTHPSITSKRRCVSSPHNSHPFRTFPVQHHVLPPLLQHTAQKLHVGKIKTNLNTTSTPETVSGRGASQYLPVPVFILAPEKSTRNAKTVSYPPPHHTIPHHTTHRLRSPRKLPRTRARPAARTGWSPCTRALSWLVSTARRQVDFSETGDLITRG